MAAPAPVLVVNLPTQPLPVAVETAPVIGVVVTNTPKEPVPIVAMLPPIFSVGATVTRGSEKTNQDVPLKVKQIVGEWAFLEPPQPNPPFVGAWFHVPSTGPWR